MVTASLWNAQRKSFAAAGVDIAAAATRPAMTCLWNFMLVFS